MLITEEEYNDLYQRGKDFIDTRCIVRRDRSNPLPGKAPGSSYTWMFYLRRGLYSSEFACATAKMFWYRVAQERGKLPFQIAGLESGAVPILAAIALTGKLLYGIEVNTFSIRKEQKQYGLKNWIEGTPIPDLPVMLVDDLCNSSTSMRRSFDVCIEHGLPICTQAFCIVNKVNKGVHSRRREVTDMYLPNFIQMLYLYDLDDFQLSNPSH